METILSAPQARAECGYTKKQWQYFLGITRTLIINILGGDGETTGSDRFKAEARELGRDIRATGKIVSTWKEVEPRWDTIAYNSVSRELYEQRLDPIPINVFEWRMRTAFGYQKRKEQQKQIDAAAGAGTASTTSPAGSAPAHSGVQLPPIWDVLQEHYENESEDR